MPWHYTELSCRLNLMIAEKNVFLLVHKVRLAVPGGLLAMRKDSLKAASAMYCAEQSPRFFKKNDF
jgi:hypothetical protein